MAQIMCRNTWDVTLSVASNGPTLRHWDACESKLISRATPAIQIARPTPPVMVVASRRFLRQLRHRRRPVECHRAHLDVAAPA